MTKQFSIVWVGGASDVSAEPALASSFLWCVLHVTKRMLPMVQVGVS